MVFITILITLITSSLFAIELPDTQTIHRQSNTNWSNIFPNAKSVILQDNWEYTINDDKSESIENLKVVKFLTYGGMKKYENYRISYNSHRWETELLNAYTMSPSGEITQIHDHEINYTKPGGIDGPATQYASLSLLVISFPALEESSTVLLHWRMNSKEQANFPYAFDRVIADEDPVLNYSLIVKHPENIEIQPLFLNGAPEPRISRNTLTFKADTIKGYVA